MLTNNTIYRVLPTQIIQFWDAIKFACKQADEVDKADMPDYFSEMLQALLSDKAQCFIVLDDKKILHSIAVTRIILNKVNFSKELHIQCLYSMTMMDNASLLRYFAFIADFAKKSDCVAVTYNSRNPRIWDIAKTVGCTERYRSFAFKLGGK